jgi:hypothetical protein
VVSGVQPGADYGPPNPTQLMENETHKSVT